VSQYKTRARFLRDRRASFILSSAILLTARAAMADDRGGPGENCRARADCQEGLKCVNFTCTAEGSPPPKLPVVETPSAPSPWMQFRFKGVYFFAGVAIQPVLAYRGVTSPSGSTWADKIRGGLLLALQGGVTINHHEIKLELAPFTYFHDFTSPGPTFEALASYGYLMPLTELGQVRLYWPFRVGAGFLTGNTGGNVYFQGMADVVGLAVGIGHVLIDVRAPAFRYGISSRFVPPPPGSFVEETAQLHLLSFFFGTNITYAF
jgi:hypothetical protein